MLRETTSPVEGFIIDATLCGLFEGIKETESINDHYNYCEFVTLGNFGNGTNLVLISFRWWTPLTPPVSEFELLHWHKYM